MLTRALKNKSINFLHALIRPYLASTFSSNSGLFSQKINKKYCIDETNPAISELMQLSAIFSLLTKKAVQEERHFLK